MLYSNIDDHFTRIGYLKSSLDKIYSKIKNSTMRERILSGRGEVFPFSVEDYEMVMLEKSLLEILLVWVLITFESILNYCIAESIIEIDKAIKAIENPKEYAKSMTHSKLLKSDLQLKILIIGGDDDDTSNVAESITKLITIRNQIVHSKPFRISQIEETVKVVNYSKWQIVETSFKYEMISELLKI